MLQLDAEMADMVGGLDEGAADIMVANDAELEGNLGGIGVTHRRGHPRIGHRHDDVRGNAGFVGELGADALAHFIDAEALDLAVGAAK